MQNSEMISCCDRVGEIFIRNKGNKGQLITKYETKEISILCYGFLYESAHCTII